MQEGIINNHVYKVGVSFSQSVACIQQRTCEEEAED